ncbi:MAG: GrpB family protein [Candidatus Obscuribacter sp.]|nr:GrpB family protein [Candidatus Obscuribacter sp.]
MIVIQQYNPLWADQYEAERERIKQALGPLLADIDHIGSTSVPGLAAKPIIDIMPAIHQSVELDLTVAPMLRAGYAYIYQYEDTLPQRRLFKRHQDSQDDSDTVVLPAVNIHLVKINTPFFHRHLKFRDILRQDQSIRDAYQKLKLELAPQYTVVNDYAQAKDDFIDSVLLAHGIVRE